MKHKIFRHGDVDGREIESIPSTAKLLDTKTVAYGEVTGHHHTFTGQVLVYQPIEGQTIKIDGEDIPVQKYIEVKEDSTLIHQEHNQILVQKGVYAILQEREWNPFEQQIRNVLD